MSINRRDFLRITGGSVLALSAGNLLDGCANPQATASTFIGQVSGYDREIATLLRAGFQELGVTHTEMQGKRILLKPNLVEPMRGSSHVNTHPAVVQAAIEAFLAMGAASVLVAEGPGLCRDSVLTVEESGISEILRSDRTPFIDLNYQPGFQVKNAGGHTRLPTLTLPATLRQVDWIVSLAKLKTHWLGVTLSLKNLFGLMPGNYYGWPKSLLHRDGAENSVLDINATVRPHFAIVDGIVGMAGNGPIMGTPHQAGVIVMGRNLAAVDATCCRIMGIDPRRIPYLAAARSLGPITEDAIQQRGAQLRSVITPFATHQTFATAIDLPPT